MRSYEENRDTDQGSRAPRLTRRPETDALARPTVNRMAAADAVLTLQRAAGNAAVARLISAERADDQERSPVLDVIGRGGGQPLEPAVKSNMEKRLGADFNDVRVHVGPQAATSAASVQARAYTVGNEIVFGEGSYNPATSGGQHTLAHELTHVLQQRSGPVAGTPTRGGIALSDPADSFERAAESNADRVTSAAPAVQRQDDEGEDYDEAEEYDQEEAAQGLTLQRQDDLAEGEVDEEEATAG